jgi:hypothetical protein
MLARVDVLELAEVASNLYLSLRRILLEPDYYRKLSVS